jgi:hypothetical protein
LLHPITYYNTLSEYHATTHTGSSPVHSPL